MLNQDETEMEALLVKVLENKVETVDVNGLEDYYKLLHCTTIDIVNRGINGKRYDIICDDEGTFSDAPLISVIDDLGRVTFVGNLIVCGGADEVIYSATEMLRMEKKNRKKLGALADLPVYSIPYAQVKKIAAIKNHIWCL